MHDACRQGQLSLFYTIYAAQNDLNIANTVSSMTQRSYIDTLHVHIRAFTMYVMLKTVVVMSPN